MERQKKEEKRPRGRHAELANLGVVYNRVSSREQAEGYSLDHQTDTCLQLAKNLNVELAHEPFVDVQTAKQPGRPAFKRMLAFLKKNPRVRTIIAHKVDRLYRNTFDMAAVEALNCSLHFVAQKFSNDAAGNLSIFMQSGIARFYSQNLREEVMKGLTEKVQRGGTPFRAPHGYCHAKGTGEPPKLDPDRRDGLRAVFQDAASGSWTLDQISDRAFRRGYRYTNSNPRIPKSTLAAILANPYYAGVIAYRGETYDGVHEPLITQELFERVQEMTTRTVHGYSKNTQIPLRGVMRCACGRAVSGELKNKTTSTGTRQYYYYRCARYSECSEAKGRRLTLADLSDALRNSISAITMPEQHEVLRDAVLFVKSDADRIREQTIRDLERRAIEVRQKIDALGMEKLKGNMSDVEFRRLQQHLRQGDADLRTQIRDLRSQESSSADLADRLPQMFGRILALWDSMDMVEREHLIKLLCVTHVLDANGVEPVFRRPFDLCAKPA